MFPPAPARFSTTTDCPHASLSFCASCRAITSVAPPAAKGTTIFTGFDGHAWPSAANDASAKPTAPNHRTACFANISLLLRWVVSIVSRPLSTREHENEPTRDRESAGERGERL